MKSTFRCYWKTLGYSKFINKNKYKKVSIRRNNQNDKFDLHITIFIEIDSRICMLETETKKCKYLLWGYFYLKFVIYFLIKNVIFLF